MGKSKATKPSKKEIKTVKKLHKQKQSGKTVYKNGTGDN